MKLSNCFNFQDFRRLAAKRLPSPIFDYIDGAADDEQTYKRNTEAYNEVDLVPSVLKGVEDVDLSTTIFGKHLSLPVYCAPTAVQRLFHHEGERAVAKAADKYRTMFGVSSLSTVSVEDISKISSGPKMFQFYFHKDRGLNSDMIERAKNAKFDVLALTVDTITGGNRERDLRSGFAIPPKLNISSLLSFILKPKWGINYEDIETQERTLNAIKTTIDQIELVTSKDTPIPLTRDTIHVLEHIVDDLLKSGYGQPWDDNWPTWRKKRELDLGGGPPGIQKNYAGEGGSGEPWDDNWPQWRKEKELDLGGGPGQQRSQEQGRPWWDVEPGEPEPEPPTNGNGGFPDIDLPWWILPIIPEGLDCSELPPEPDTPKPPPGTPIDEMGDYPEWQQYYATIFCCWFGTLVPMLERFLVQLDELLPKLREAFEVLKNAFAEQCSGIFDSVFSEKCRKLKEEMEEAMREFDDAVRRLREGRDALKEARKQAEEICALIARSGNGGGSGEPWDDSWPEWRKKKERDLGGAPDGELNWVGDYRRFADAPTGQPTSIRAEYKKNDVVVFNNKTYIATRDTTGQIPSNPNSGFEYLADRGLLPSKCDGGTF